jgi:undecaprenyl-diphosphatase
MEQIKQLDREFFLWLNNAHTALLDQPMYWMTKILFWLPLYILLIFLLFKKLGKQSWWALLCVTIAIVLSDQLMTSFMKPFFARLRPSHEPSLKGLVHLVNNYRGGLYGFASGHAATTFAVATIVWLLLRHHYRWMSLVFLWAALMTYTRIYLGVHYPGDILVGAIAGIICGWLGFRIYQYILKKKIPSVA